MKAAPLALSASAILLLSACEVNVDNKTEAQIDNAASDVSADLGNAARGAAATAERLGNAVERGADSLDNRVDVNVNLHGDDDGNAATSNRQ